MANEIYQNIADNIKNKVTELNNLLADATENNMTVVIKYSETKNFTNKEKLQVKEISKTITKRYD